MTSDQPWWLTMPVRELAATILPLFSSHAPARENRVTTAIVSWFRTGSYSLPSSWDGLLQQFEHPDFNAVAEAIQDLEHAGLLMRVQDGTYNLHVGLTRLGWQALKTNTVRQHLGLGDAPPPA